MHQFKPIPSIFIYHENLISFLMGGLRDESNALRVAFIGFRIYLDQFLFKLKYCVYQIR